MAAGETCRIPRCQNILKYQDGQVCGAHRLRFYRHGSYDISPNYTNLKKGTPSITKYGYLRININGKRVLQHRHIMEQHLGRSLNNSECVHHKNGDKTDNRIENLELLKNNQQHMKTKHKHIWHKRNVRPPYTAETIHNIIMRLSEKPTPSQCCFCGKKYEAKNLCSAHYQWAYKHKFL